MSQLIKIFTLANCPHSRNAKSLLSQSGIRFDEKLMDDEDDQSWEALEKKSGCQTVPQIFKGEKFIGGESDLIALNAIDHLESLKH